MVGFRLWHFETCRPVLPMSVHRGRPEVSGASSNRRADPAPASVCPHAFFAIGIEHPFLVSVRKCSHDADPRQHRWAAPSRDQHQGFHRRQPFRGLMLGLRHLGNELPASSNVTSLATAPQRYRLVEFSFPAAINAWPANAATSCPMDGSCLSRCMQAILSLMTNGGPQNKAA